MEPARTSCASLAFAGLAALPNQIDLQVNMTQGTSAPEANLSFSMDRIHHLSI